MGFGSSSGLEVTMVFVAALSTVINMALRHQQVRQLSCPLSCKEPSVVTGATEINSDHGCCRATDPGMALGNSANTGDIVALSDSAGYTDGQGPSLQQYTLWPLATQTAGHCMVLSGDRSHRHHTGPL